MCRKNWRCWRRRAPVARTERSVLRAVQPARSARMILNSSVADESLRRYPHPQPFSPREKGASSLSLGERVGVRERSPARLALRGFSERQMKNLRRLASQAPRSPEYAALLPGYRNYFSARKNSRTMRVRSLSAGTGRSIFTLSCPWNR